MNLVTPDSGLLFWMIVIFGIVFFLLAKFGFPIITRSVDERSARIDKSLKDARDIEERMASWTKKEAKMREDARKGQALMLREAAEEKNRIIADARSAAKSEADKLLADARTSIAAEKESALRDVRREVAVLGVEVAEKILREELSGADAQRAYLEKMLDEAAKADTIK